MRLLHHVEMIFGLVEVLTVAFPCGDLLFLLADRKIGTAGNQDRGAACADLVVTVDCIGKDLAVAVKVILSLFPLHFGLALGLDFLQNGGGSIHLGAVFAGGAIGLVAPHAHHVVSGAGGALVDLVVVRSGNRCGFGGGTLGLLCALLCGLFSLGRVLLCGGRLGLGCVLVDGVFIRNQVQQTVLFVHSGFLLCVVVRLAAGAGLLCTVQPC